MSLQKPVFKVAKLVTFLMPPPLSFYISLTLLPAPRIIDMSAA